MIYFLVFYVVFVLFCSVVVLETDSLWSPDCLGTHYIDQVALEVRDLPALPSLVLGRYVPLQPSLTLKYKLPHIRESRQYISFCIWFIPFTMAPVLFIAQQASIVCLCK